MRGIAPGHAYDDLFGPELCLASCPPPSPPAINAIIAIAAIFISSTLGRVALKAQMGGKKL